MTTTAASNQQRAAQANQWQHQSVENVSTLAVIARPEKLGCFCALVVFMFVATYISVSVQISTIKIEQQSQQEDTESASTSHAFSRSLLSLSNIFANNGVTSNIATTATRSWTTPTGVEIQTRIVGGIAVTDPEKYPSFGFNFGMGLCGGTLIHPDIVLTAAHCGTTFDEGWLQGGTTIDGAKSEFIAVQQSFPHPNYKPGPEVNDIMLLHLASPSSAPLQPLNFDPSVPPDGATVTVIGYGNTAESGQSSFQLQEVDSNIVGFDLCNTYFGTIDNDIQVCMGGNEGKDSCQGDSGGPLLLEDGTQVGIVSFGAGCARPNVPASVFTRVSGYKQWIEDGICQLSNQKPESCDGAATPTEAPFTAEPSAATDAPTTPNSTTEAPTSSDNATEAPNSTEVNTTEAPATAEDATSVPSMAESTPAPSLATNANATETPSNAVSTTEAPTTAENATSAPSMVESTPAPSLPTNATSGPTPTEAPVRPADPSEEESTLSRTEPPIIAASAPPSTLASIKSPKRSPSSSSSSKSMKRSSSSSSSSTSSKQRTVAPTTSSVLITSRSPTQAPSASLKRKHSSSSSSKSSRSRTSKQRGASKGSKGSSSRGRWNEFLSNLESNKSSSKSSKSSYASANIFDRNASDDERVERLNRLWSIIVGARRDDRMDQDEMVHRNNSNNDDGRQNRPNHVIVNERFENAQQQPIP